MNKARVSPRRGLNNRLIWVCYSTTKVLLGNACWITLEKVGYGYTVPEAVAEWAAQ